MTTEDNRRMLSISDKDDYFTNLLAQITNSLELKNRSQAIKWSILNLAQELEIIDEKESARAKVVRL